MDGVLEAPAAAPPRRKTRWWLLALIVLGCAATLVYLWSAEDVEIALRIMDTMKTAAVTLLLLLMWFVLFTGLRWRTRLTTLGVLLALSAAAGFAAPYFVEMDGSTNGSGLPHLVWHPPWQPPIPKPDAGLGDPVVTSGKTADLSVVRDEDSPQFRGPRRDGVVHGVNLAPDWSASAPRKLWGHRVGVGWSSFAVAGGCAITQEQRGDKELVVCYDLKSGEPLWSHADPVRFNDKQGGDGPRATPTIDHGRVYTLGGTGILNCLRGTTGERIWSANVLDDHGLPNLIWGLSSSPLVVDDLVVVSGGGQAGGPSLLAYHKKSGKPVWQAGDDKASFSSPLLATLAGRRQIVMVNALSVTGHDPADGHVLWHYPWGEKEWPKASQPVVVGEDRLLLSAGYGLGAVLLQVSDQSSGGQAVTEVWKNRHLRTQFSSIVVRNGYAYGLDDGILECINLSTGDREWKDGRYGYGQVVLADDLLVVQAESGAVVLVEATPEGHHERGRLAALDAKTWNYPVLAGPFLLVRNDREAACYKLPVRAAK